MESCWNEIKSCIVEAVEESIDRRKVNINEANNNKKFWFNRKRNPASFIYRNSPTPEKHSEYTEPRNRINAIKRDYWAKSTEESLKNAEKQKKLINKFLHTGITNDPRMGKIIQETL